MKQAHREVVAYLRSVGAEDVRIEAGGKHPRAVFMWKGRERYKAVSGTPSDWHATNSAIRELREMLGLLDREKRVGIRRQQKERARKAAATAPIITPLPDWHEHLYAARLVILPADELNVVAWQAWRGFWRDCMHSVGAVSAL